MEPEDVVSISCNGIRTLENSDSPVEKVLSLAFTERASRVLIVQHDLWLARSTAEELLSLCWCADLLSQYDYALFLPDFAWKWVENTAPGFSVLYEYGEHGKISGGVLGSLVCPFTMDESSPRLPFKGLEHQFSRRLNLMRLLALTSCYNLSAPARSWPNPEGAVKRFAVMIRGFMEDPGVTSLPISWICECSRLVRFFDWNSIVPDEKTHLLFKQVSDCREIWAASLGDGWEEIINQGSPELLAEKYIECGLADAFAAYKAGVPLSDIAA